MLRYPVGADRLAGLGGISPDDRGGAGATGVGVRGMGGPVRLACRPDLPGVHEVAVRWTPLTRVTGRLMRSAGTGPRAGRPCPAVKSSLPARDGGEVGMGATGTGGDVEPHDMVLEYGISGHDAAATRA